MITNHFSLLNLIHRGVLPSFKLCNIVCYSYSLTLVLSLAMCFLHFPVCLSVFLSCQSFSFLIFTHIHAQRWIGPECSYVSLCSAERLSSWCSVAPISITHCKTSWNLNAFILSARALVCVWLQKGRLLYLSLVMQGIPGSIFWKRVTDWGW